MLGLFPDDEGRDPLRFLGATLIHSLSSSSPTTDPPEVEMTECVGEGALEVGVEVDGRELLLLLLLWAFRFVLVWRAVTTAAVALDLDEEELYMVGIVSGNYAVLRHMFSTLRDTQKHSMSE